MPRKKDKKRNQYLIHSWQRYKNMQVQIDGPLVWFRNVPVMVVLKFSWHILHEASPIKFFISLIIRQDNTISAQNTHLDCNLMIYILNRNS